MSEFSESYHFYKIPEEKLLNSIKGQGITGYYFKSENNWITVIPEDSKHDILNKILDLNHGLFLHYIFVGDYGWEFTLYEGKKPICGYHCLWGEEFLIESDNLDTKVLKDKLGITLSDEETKKIFFPVDFEQAYSTQPAYRFMEKLFIKHYENISFDLLQGLDDRNKDIFNELNAHRIKKNVK